MQLNSVVEVAFRGRNERGHCMQLTAYFHLHKINSILFHLLDSLILFTFILLIGCDHHTQVSPRSNHRDVEVYVQPRRAVAVAGMPSYS